MHRAVAGSSTQARGVRETGGNPLDAPRKEAVGASQHGVLLVDHGRNAELAGRQHCRQRGIATEADHRLGIEPAQQTVRLDDADRHPDQAPGGLQQPAAEPPRPYHRDVDAGQRGGEGIGAPIGGEVHRRAARNKLLGERLRRKQMSAGAAGGEHEGKSGVRPAGGAHNSAPPSRRRVNASSMPMPNASASIDDPP